MYNNVKFYQKIWFMWFTLFLFAPVGIFLMWKYKRFNKLSRAVLSCVFTILFIVSACSYQSSRQVNNTTNVLSQNQSNINAQTSINKKLAANLDARITDLGDTSTITLDKSADVKAIRETYENLNIKQKKLVRKLTSLTTAETTIANLQVAADKAEADKIAADKAAADKIAADKAAADKALADKAAATTQTNNNEYIVYITRTGSKYHRDGCRYLSRSKISISKSEAITEGYSPCSVCNP